MAASQAAYGGPIPLTRFDYMKNLIIIFILFLVVGCASSPTYIGPRSPISTQVIPGLHHRVEPKQTLWIISRIYNVDIDDIFMALPVGNHTDSYNTHRGAVVVYPDVRHQADIQYYVSVWYRDIDRSAC